MGITSTPFHRDYEDEVMTTLRLSFGFDFHDNLRLMCGSHAAAHCELVRVHPQLRRIPRRSHSTVTWRKNLLVDTLKSRQALV